MDKPDHFSKISQPEILGYLTDSNKIGYSRDIGRSFILGGNVYHIFGDTFCKDSAGEFVGLVSNTVSMVHDPAQPLEGSYLSIAASGLVEPLISLTVEEERLQEEYPEQRVTLWAFGGVVEVQPGVGLTWYQKGIQHKGENERHEYCGTGIAKLVVDKDTNILQTHRYPGLVFDHDEPKLGSFSVLKHEQHVYLYGEQDTNMLLARVTAGHELDRHKYEYWNGHGWDKDNYSAAVPVFTDIPQGQVFQSSALGKHRPFILIGVSQWADSKIRVGFASKPQGPWEIQEASMARGIDQPDGFMYCIYPHPWAFADEDDSLMVSWSEHWPGGVIAAKIRFDVAHPKMVKDEL